MMRFARTLGTVCVAAAAACVTPTDKSDTLRIEMNTIPAQLFKGDSVRLEARLVDEAGMDVPNAEVVFTTSDDLVLRVREDGTLLAIEAGSATVTAAAPGFAETAARQQSVLVRGLLEVDSIRPRNVRYGEFLNLFGVGLNPDSLFAVTLGAEPLPFASFTPVDPAAPNRLGLLSLWVAPPARTAQAVAVLGFAGGLTILETIRVTRTDLFEPNDTLPYDFGTLSAPIENPALAFEAIRVSTPLGGDPVVSGDAIVPTDWYTFTTAAPGDWTIDLQSASGAPVGVLLSDSIGWDGFLFDVGLAIYPLGGQGWTVGAEAAACQGQQLYYEPGDFYVSPFELLDNAATLSLRSLPAGTYSLLVFYGPFFTFFDSFANRVEYDIFLDDAVNVPQPVQHRINIQAGYQSALAPDAQEENDYCDVAGTLGVPGTLTNLTIDNPHDMDWFRFTLASPQNVVFGVTARDTTADPDLYVVRNLLPDSLKLVDFGLSFGPDEATFGCRDPAVTCDAFEAGDYFLIVADFPGVPTTYDLGAGIVPAPPAGAAASRAAAAGSALLQKQRSTGAVLRGPDRRPVRR